MIMIIAKSSKIKSFFILILENIADMPYMEVSYFT